MNFRLCRIDFWYRYYVQNNVRETTRATYEGNIYKHIIPAIGKLKLNQITQADLQKFYSEQLKVDGESDRSSTVRACPTAWFATSMPSARVRWM